MYFPRFLIGMFTTSGLVAIWAYTATGSVWKALVWTIIAAVVLQVGYFAVVVRRISNLPADQQAEPDADAVYKEPVMPTSQPRRFGSRRGRA
ncbi:MAG: exopolysaccharide production repressor protein [Mesorhizobium sp.]